MRREHPWWWAAVGGVGVGLFVAWATRSGITALGIGLLTFLWQGVYLTALEWEKRRREASQDVNWLSRHPVVGAFVTASIVFVGLLVLRIADGRGWADGLQTAAILASIVLGLQLATMRRG